MQLLDDFRFGARVLAKQPWTTALIVVLLAAGIGVNTTVFTLVNGALVKSLPYEDGERILYLEGRNVERSQDMRTSLLDFIDWRDQTVSFERLAAYAMRQFNLADDETAPERVSGAEISVDGFQVLRVGPQIGRGFAENEREPGADPVAIISHATWQKRYGGTDDVIGQPLRIDQQEKTIIGVMPAGFRFPNKAEVWLPLKESGDAKRDNRRLGVYGKLAPSKTPAEAQVEMTLIGQRLQQAHPDSNKGVDVIVQTFNENFNGGQIRTVFLAMIGAVGFVLLIACANVANVQLARAIDRAKEISVGAALGAGKWRIFRQLLAESLLLSFAGGALGFAFARVGVRYFDQATEPIRPFFVDFSFDLSILAYLTAICLAAGILFGLAPALHAVRRDLTESLKEGRGQTASSRTRFFASSMVAGEVALALILLVGAGLMIRSFWYMYSLDIGAHTEGILSAAIELPEAQYPEPEDRFEFNRRLLLAIQTMPGVVGAVSASNEPGRGANGLTLELETAPAEDSADRPRERYIMVSPGYFNFFEAPLLSGRDFGPIDTPAAPKVALVNNAFAQKYWSTENPIGKRLRLEPNEDGERPLLEIVGVAPDIRSTNRGDIEPIVYRTFNQEAWDFRRLLVRASGDAAALTPAVRQTVADLDPNLPVFDAMTLNERLAEGRWMYKVFGSLFATFAVIALAMSAAGIYGLVAYSVGRRTPEFGIRMALGAASNDILQLVFRQGMWRVGIGIVIGLPATYFAAQVLQSLLAGVEATEPLMLGGAALFLLAIAAVACWLPARRAASVRPSTALRRQ
ncbi:MAG: ABC transporter permease [Acidobacteria bacterium]|nr:ABC transporter permease [Acidobacteriota bacterium]